MSPPLIGGSASKEALLSNKKLKPGEGGNILQETERKELPIGLNLAPYDDNESQANGAMLTSPQFRQLSNDKKRGRNRDAGDVVGDVDGQGKDNSPAQVE